MKRLLIKKLLFLIPFLFMTACLGGTPSSTSTTEATDSNTETTTGYTVAAGVVKYNGTSLHLFGVNWFGAETSSYVVHGLWARTYQDMIDQMKTLGFNAVRLPFCPATLEGITATSIDTSLNSDLAGKNSLELLDIIMNALNDSQMYILLDHHRPDCTAISELWTTDSYSEQNWLDDLALVADRYKDLPYFMGIDLKNEPHGAATWGSGDTTTDWDQAAKRAANAVLAVNSNLLIFVEGIQENSTCSSSSNAHWWGGNLEPQNCYPLDIESDKLVLSPHVYGPDVYAQSYFSDSNFPANMSGIWDTQFGFLVDQDITIVPGEFGGKYGEGDSRDVDWQNTFVDYLIDNQVCNFFYWSWNPDSGDTGGILADDWQTVNENKYNNLKRLMDACSGN